ncbi:hypothetical protein BUALT_Bualt05G0018700 [Buddleja alternifolia]|uniref:TFIIS central domain-containing protein n=1 Tax=Buddleja alternifolia TaxID=168488 RepID=A0AAV6XH95_9LAMI|nr:hypothetical protein BUALT_Bualt05G0018700 [Buddleja alternifolia]
MSNNLVSQFPISDRHVVQMENVSSPMNSAVSGMQMRMVSHVSNSPESHHFVVSKEQMGLVEPISSDPHFKTLMTPNNSVGHTESSGDSMGSSGIWMPNQLNSENGVMNNMVGENTSLPLKRKADVGSMSNSSNSQQSLLPNKRPAQVGADVSSPRFLQPSAPQRKAGPARSNPASPGLHAQSSLNKKIVRNDSMPGKSGLQRGQPAKRQSTQTGSAAKARPESSEAVRSKMRESLAAALDLAFQKPDFASNTEKNEIDAIVDHKKTVDSQASESNSTVGGRVISSGSEVFPSKELAVGGTIKDSHVLSAELPPNEGVHSFQEFQYSLADEDVSFSDNFFVKDDLLQGNGLSWAFDFDAQMREVKEAQSAEKPQDVEEEAHDHRDKSEVAILTPENLAFKIEGELFKLYDGVNKKYKEKGRSLLFNLKDRNNPELRERVMSGEISPERLCSMSAEELASKELSEWRMAKAEEMAQMVVLPDVEVDVRRLVKKTHKGEYQVVEFERDDGNIAEVSGGTSILTQPQSKKENETHSHSQASLKDKLNVGGQDGNLENQDFSGSLIIPTDGTDLMQGMMVDELKDAEFLPPIVSLDEFMESLNSEPPFENLSPDAAQKTPISHEERPKAVDSSRATDQTLISPKDASSKKADIVKKHKFDVIAKSSGSPANQKVLSSAASKVEYIWEGILHLTVSSSVTVGGLYQSGEKTSTREWPTSLEIKGRVRLDAFEKFLQELPMSRTRAVMTRQCGLPLSTVNRNYLSLLLVWMYTTICGGESAIMSTLLDVFASIDKIPRFCMVLFISFTSICKPDVISRLRIVYVQVLQFVLKDKSSENELFNLSEAIDSYASDERLGYAEPGAGVELYLCPPIPKLTEMLNKNMQKKSPETSYPIEKNTLIGVVVWRRAHISNTISPNSSSHHKHATKKQPFTHSRAQESPNVSVNTPTRTPPPVINNFKPDPQPDEDDDIPPGFGPGAPKDDDDLPEFNFLGNINPNPPVPRIPTQNLHHSVKMPQRPVDQVRELIQKYGQSGNNNTVTNRTWVDNRPGLGIEPWNDDDDDDIPEWRPQAPHQLHHHPYPVVHGHKPPVVPPNRAMGPVISPRHGHPPPGGRWVQPPGPNHGARWRQYN